MCGIIPCRASWLMGYCFTLTGVAFAFNSTTMGGLCLASPTPAISAQAREYFCYIAGSRAAGGFGEYSLYSSLSARDKT